MLKIRNLLFIPICLLSSCDSLHFNLPFPEYGSYRKDAVKTEYGGEYTITNIKFEIVRDGSNRKNDSFVTEFMNEYDKENYFAKFSFDINGQTIAMDSEYLGPSKVLPGNIYNFGLKFSIGDKQIQNYKIALITAYNSSKKIKNTMDVGFTLNTIDGPWTLSFNTGLLDTVSVVGEDF